MESQNGGKRKRSKETREKNKKPSKKVKGAKNGEETLLKQTTSMRKPGK